MLLVRYILLLSMTISPLLGSSRAGAQPLPTGIEAPAPAPTLALAAGKGISVTSADGSFQFGVRARVQARASLSHDEQRTTEDVQIRTVRLVVAGHTLVPELKYLIQFAFGNGDFEKDSASPLFDAFVEYTGHRDLNVRVGQFFVPFDRARTIREFALQFVDRQGVVRELSLDRDVGVMLSSSDLFGLGSRLAYALFVGGGDGRNRVPDPKAAKGPQTPGVLVVGRVTVRPLGAFDDDLEGDLTRSPSPHLALGVATGYNVASIREKSTYGGTYTLGTFDYLHVAADLVFKWHGFSLLAEWLLRRADRDLHEGLGPTGSPLVERSRSGHGYFAQVGQMLTSKLELTGRWEELRGTNRALRDEALRSGRQLGGGLNLYLNGHALKLQSDYFYTFGSELSEGSHGARVQLDASF